MLVYAKMLQISVGTQLMGNVKADIGIISRLGKTLEIKSNL